MPCTELDTDRGDGVSGIVISLLGVAADRFPGVLCPGGSPSPPLPPIPPNPYRPPPAPRGMLFRAGVTKPSFGHVDDAVDVDPRVLLDEFDPVLLSLPGFSRSDREESSSSPPAVPAAAVPAAIAAPAAMAAAAVGGLSRPSAESPRVAAASPPACRPSVIGAVDCSAWGFTRGLFASVSVGPSPLASTLFSEEVNESCVRKKNNHRGRGGGQRPEQQQRSHIQSAKEKHASRKKKRRSLLEDLFGTSQVERMHACMHA